MTPEQQTILDLLKTATRDRPVDRFKVGLSERAFRNAIADLQEHGHPVVSLGKGYWLGTPQEVDAYARREKHRAETILAKLKRLRPKLKTVVNQLEFGF